MRQHLIKDAFDTLKYSVFMDNKSTVLLNIRSIYKMYSGIWLTNAEVLEVYDLIKAEVESE